MNKWVNLSLCLWLSANAGKELFRPPALMFPITQHLPLHRLPRAVPFRIGCVYLILLISLVAGGGCALQKDLPPSPRPAEDPRLVAQSRLLQDAEEYLDRGQSRMAVRLLRHVLDSYPPSSLHSQFRWVLANALEQSGNLSAAVEEYRAVVEAATGGGPPKGKYEEVARRRLAALEPNLSSSPAGPGLITGLLLHPHRLPPANEWREWLWNLAQSGITTLVLEVGTESLGSDPAKQDWILNGGEQVAQPSGVYFRTNLAMVRKDLINRIIPQAHEQGVSVFGAVTPRRMAWLKPKLGWADWAYDPEQLQIRPSSALDLFHPGYQEYLTDLLTDLVAAGIDGLLFRADVPMGPMEGFSTFALHSFRSQVGTELDPVMLFGHTGPDTFFSPSSKNLGDFSSYKDYPPDFWRWAGFKAREQLKVLERLMRTLLQQAPHLTFALEVHPEAITDPVEALVRYSEDLLEAKHSGFHYILTRADDPKTSASLRSSVTMFPNNGEDIPTVVPRLIELMGEANRVWVRKSLSSTESGTWKNLNPHADRLSLPQGTGLLYTVSPVPVP